jgi:hypothetical protein
VVNIAKTIRKITGNAIASFEATAVIQLTRGIPLIGGQFVREYSFRKINGNALVELDTKAGTVLTIGIPLIGGQFEILSGLFHVNFDIFTLRSIMTVSALGCWISLIVQQSGFSVSGNRINHRSNIEKVIGQLHPSI